MDPLLVPQKCHRPLHEVRPTAVDGKPPDLENPIDNEPLLLEPRFPIVAIRAEGFAVFGTPHQVWRDIAWNDMVNRVGSAGDDRTDPQMVLAGISIATENNEPEFFPSHVIHQFTGGFCLI